MRFFHTDKVVLENKLDEKNLISTIQPYLDRWVVDEFSYKESAFEKEEDGLGRGVVYKILEDEFLSPALNSNGKIVTRGNMKVFNSGKVIVDVGLYRILGYDFLIPLDKSVYFTASRIKNQPI